MDESDGRINLHDALILAYAKLHGVEAIASFDADLRDPLLGTRCLVTPRDVDSLFES